MAASLRRPTMPGLSYPGLQRTLQWCSTTPASFFERTLATVRATASAHG